MPCRSHCPYTTRQEAKMPSPTPTPSTPKMGTTKYSVSRGGMQGKPLALPGEKLYNIVHAVRPGAVVQVVCAPVQAFGGSEPQKLPHFLCFILIIADAPKIASIKNSIPGNILGLARKTFSAPARNTGLPPREKTENPLKKQGFYLLFPRRGCKITEYPWTAPAHRPAHSGARPQNGRVTSQLPTA